MSSAFCPFTSTYQPRHVPGRQQITCRKHNVTTPQRISTSRQHACMTRSSALYCVASSEGTTRAPGDAPLDLCHEARERNMTWCCKVLVFCCSSRVVRSRGLSSLSPVTLENHPNICNPFGKTRIPPHTSVGQFAVLHKSHYQFRLWYKQIPQGKWYLREPVVRIPPIYLSSLLPGVTKPAHTLDGNVRTVWIEYE